MFIAACEGYFDKQNDLSALMRMQTLCIVQSSGAKLSGNRDVKVTDLWTLPGDKELIRERVGWGTKEEALSMMQAIEKAHGIKIGKRVQSD